MQSNATTPISRRAPAAVPRKGVPLLIAACGFVACYLASDLLVVSQLASSTLPRADDPAWQVRDWFSQNRLAAVLMGLCQAISVSFLVWFATGMREPRARRWGFLAVGLMVLSCCCAWMLAGVAPHASLGTENVLRQANFLTGGLAHVLALCLFVFLASRTGGFGRPARLLGGIALVVSVLSLSSLIVEQGAAFILLGRLLAMAWTISAAVGILLRGRSGTP